MTLEVQLIIHNYKLLIKLPTKGFPDFGYPQITNHLSLPLQIRRNEENYWYNPIIFIGDYCLSQKNSADSYNKN